MQVRISPELAEEIRHLPPEHKQLLRDGINLLAQNANLGKPLRKPLLGLRSLRLKKFRLIYRMEKNCILLVAFAKRRTVYGDLEVGTADSMINEPAAEAFSPR